MRLVAASLPLRDECLLSCLGEREAVILIGGFGFIIDFLGCAFSFVLTAITNVKVIQISAHNTLHL